VFGESRYKLKGSDGKPPDPFVFCLGGTIMACIEELEPRVTDFRFESPVITTPRLVLRHPDKDDVADIAFLANNPKVASMVARMPYPYCIQDARSFVERNGTGGPNGGVYAVTMRATGRFIGCAGLDTSKGSGLELGYWLGEPFWGQGFATEAAHALVDLAFRNSTIAQITAGCRLTNPASKRVIQKSGFQHAGIGMMNSLAAGPVSIERFVLDRKTWESLRSWGE
jgi:RimJ/RimL family protein N-acetyltransferase